MEVEKVLHEVGEVLYFVYGGGAEGWSSFSQFGDGLAESSEFIDVAVEAGVVC